MPWSPVMDQDKWYKAIQTVSETLKKTQDNFDDPDWDAVAEKYAQDGGRFKAILPQDPKERDLRTGRDDVKKVSGLMTADVHVDDAMLKSLEESGKKVTADFVRFSQLVEGRTPSAPKPAGRQLSQQRPAFAPVVPQLTESPSDDVRQSMRTLMGSSRTRTTTAPPPAPPVTEEDNTPPPAEARPVRKPIRKLKSISESVTDVASGKDAREVARKLIEHALRK